MPINQTMVRLVLMTAVNAGLILGGEPLAGDAGASADSNAPEFAVVRQGPSLQTRLTDRPGKYYSSKARPATPGRRSPTSCLAMSA
jgi:hypothetical protein